MTLLSHVGRADERLGRVLKWVVFACLELLILAQAILAYRDDVLAFSQVASAQGLRALPLMWHFGIWGDLLVVSPVVAYLCARYSGQWGSRTLLLSLTIATVVSGLCGWSWTQQSVPEAHMQNHHLTDAGALHVLYLVLALTVLIEFFVFTRSTSRVDLRVVSALLVFHAFLGTHLALGTLQLVFGFQRYPGDPLNSPHGFWVTLAIGVALLLRNVDVSLIASKARRGGDRVARVVVKLFGGELHPESLETPYGLLRFLDVVGTWVVQAGFFIAAALHITSRSQGFMSILASGLVFAIALRFFLSRLCVRMELSISKLVFPDGLPKKWQGKAESLLVVLSVVGFFALYMSLAWIADRVLLVSLALFIISCIDWNTRRLINRDMRVYLNDVANKARDDDPKRPLVEAYRRVVSEYLFDKPHLRKEAACAVGCGAAFGAALVGYLTSAQWLEATAYLLLIATILANEVVTARWRSARDEGLKKVKDESGGTS